MLMIDPKLAVPVPIFVPCVQKIASLKSGLFNKGSASKAEGYGLPNK
jgi:hypothetical protein